MKKGVIVLIMLLCAAAAVSAASWGMDIALGVPMYAALTYRGGAFSFEAALDTSFGPGGLLSVSLMDRLVSTSLTAWDKFTYGSSIIHGLSTALYWCALDNPSFSFLVGTDVTALHVSSREGVIIHFTKGDMVLVNASLKTSWNFGQSSIFLKAGFPVFGYFYYGGDGEDANYAAFDFWAFVPKAIVQAEEGGYVDVKAYQLALLFALLNFKIGYSLKF